VRSSYLENNYGLAIQAAAAAARPGIMVELGVLDGYSTLHLARTARWLEVSQLCSSHLYAYDLFDEYEFNHGDQKAVQQMLAKEGVSKYVTVKRKNAFVACGCFEDEDVGLLHIDISNEGELLLKLLKVWLSKLRQGALLILEGGSEERDKVEWMVKYNKRPIRSLFEEKFFRQNFSAPMVMKPFPSITFAIRRGAQ